jgi:tetratricopeptide (TPR) repeat protein
MPLRALVTWLIEAERFDEAVNFVEQRAPQLQERESAQALLCKAALICVDALFEPGRAANLLRSVLADDPTSSIALELLDQCSQKIRDNELRVDVLRREIDLESDPARTIELLMELGRVASTELVNNTLATSAFRRVLDLDPGHPGALQALEALFTSTMSWDELLRVLERQLALAKNAAERVSVCDRMGQVLENKLGDRSKALDCFRQGYEICGSEPTLAEAASRFAAQIKRLEQETGQA